MKILVTGKNGQLGSELRDLEHQYPQYRMVFTDHEEMDLSDSVSIVQMLQREQPHVIINAGAYTAVDKAETDEQLCDAVNHTALAVIGAWAAEHAAKVIHLSTDYVFDGKTDAPLKETDATAPINVYGKTKLMGEEALLGSGAEAVIIRTSWVYSSYGANFVKTMIRLMTERDTIGVVADQVGTPTYAADLARVILKIVDAAAFVPGIYHYSNEGRISWYEFAMAIKEIKGFTCTVNAIASTAFPTPAKRPSFSLLDKTRIKETYGIVVPFWKSSLEEMLRKLG